MGSEHHSPSSRQFYHYVGLSVARLVRNTEQRHATFQNHAPVPAFHPQEYAEIAGHELTMTGSGTTRVTTAPIFRGNYAVTVLVNGTPATLSPDSTSRITIPADLGRRDQDEQYIFGAATSSRTGVVSFLR